MTVCCVFLLESPHRGDSNGYTQYTIFTFKNKNNPKLSLNLQLWDVFQGRVPGKRAINVRATEVLQHILYSNNNSIDNFMSIGNI